ncbi:MAG: hypothetical protein RLZZ628_2378 [Bacteroidota bacterium]|jgi:hypothetical protein
MKKSFENWLWEEIEDAFGLQRALQLPLLEQWLQGINLRIDASQLQFLERLRGLLASHHQDWNEEELKLNFIAPLLSFVNYYETPQYQPFAERVLKTTVGNWELSGTVDWLLATGKQVPRVPFFFIHEYKRTKMGDADPLGQLLAAMFTAKTNDEQHRPVFGTYIIGKDWYFVVLDGVEYAQSKPYQAVKADELREIINILQHIKVLAAQYLF